MEKYYLIKNLYKNKKAQAWGLDLVIASVIFLIGIIILYVYAINYSSQTKNSLDEMLYDGNLASGLILSENDFGILSNGKVNQTKLDDFYNSDYQTKKNQIGLKYDFYFVMDDLEVNGNPLNYIGKSNISEIENLIQVTRLTIYKNKPIKFDIFVWR